MLRKLESAPGRARVFDLSPAEILGFAGNCIEVGNDEGQVFLVMSARAEKALGKVD